MKDTVKIPIDLFDKFEKKVNALNKKAKKFNLPPIKVEVHGKEEVEFNYKYDDVLKAKVECYVVDIEQEEEILIKGYKYVGITEDNKDNVIFMGNEDVPEEVKNKKECEHCHVKRYRKYHVILKNVETDEYLVVGKTCMKDFVGDGNIETMVNYLTEIAVFFQNMEEEENEFKTFGMNFHVNTYYKVEDVLAIANEIIWKDGCYKNAEYWGASTRDQVFDFYDDKKKLKDLSYLLEKWKDAIEDQTKFILEINADNNYLQNLQTIVKEGECKDKFMGFLVSLPCAYEKHVKKVEKEKKEKEKANKLPSDYVGNIKDKVEMTVKYVREIAFDGFYGTTFMYFFEANDKDVIVWKTTTCKDFETDKAYKMKATIKDHNLYNETKQTFVIRPKFM